MEYEVSWSIYIEADSPEDAAIQAKGILQDPYNEAWVFSIEGDSKVHYIDVEDADEPYRYHATKDVTK